MGLPSLKTKFKNGGPRQAAMHGRSQTSAFQLVPGSTPGPQVTEIGYLRRGRAQTRALPPRSPGHVPKLGRVHSFPILAFERWPIPENRDSSLNPDPERDPEGVFPLRNLERCRSTYTFQISTNFYKFLRILENPEIWVIREFIKILPTGSPILKSIGSPGDLRGGSLREGFPSEK